MKSDDTNSLRNKPNRHRPELCCKKARGVPYHIPFKRSERSVRTVQSVNTTPLLLSIKSPTLLSRSCFPHILKLSYKIRFLRIHPKSRVRTDKVCQTSAKKPFPVGPNQNLPIAATLSEPPSEVRRYKICRSNTATVFAAAIWLNT